MIAVDTSVWVAALRSAESVEGSALARLLDEDEVLLPIPVRIELLGGASNRDRPTLRRVLSALPVVAPSETTWGLIDGWIERAAWAGERFGFADLLIAALSAGEEADVWSRDGDFRRMARLGFVTLFVP